MPEALAATKDARPSKLRAEIINLLKITENKKKEKKKHISSNEHKQQTFKHANIIKHW